MRRGIRAGRPPENPRRDNPVALRLDAVQEGGGGVFKGGLDGGAEGGADGEDVHVEDDVDGGVLKTPDYASGSGVQGGGWGSGGVEMRITPVRDAEMVMGVSSFL